MMRKNIAQILKRVRRDTGNTKFSATNGLTNTDLIEFLTEAQNTIQTAIINSGARGAFEAEHRQDIVAGQEVYSMPVDAITECGVTHLEASTTGSEDDFVTLRPIGYHEKLNVKDGTPSKYIYRDVNVLLNPVSNRNVPLGLKMQYKRALPSLDTARGTVASVTLTSSPNTITALTLSTTGLEADELKRGDYITIVDRLGNIKMDKILIDDVDQGTGVVTVNAAFEYEDGQTIAVGDVAVSGFRASTHSQLPDFTERYLVRYCTVMIQNRTSDDDLMNNDAILTRLESDIVEKWSNYNNDVEYIPVLNHWIGE